eukprot:6208951-Pleurochrysis_carterae.AAC.2
MTVQAHGHPGMAPHQKGSRHRKVQAQARAWSRAHEETRDTSAGASVGDIVDMHRRVGEYAHE